MIFIPYIRAYLLIKYRSTRLSMTTVIYCDIVCQYVCTNNLKASKILFLQVRDDIQPPWRLQILTNFNVVSIYYNNQTDAIKYALIEEK